MKKKVLALLPAGVWAVIVLVLAVLPTYAVCRILNFLKWYFSGMEQFASPFYQSYVFYTSGNIDKVAHFFGYAVLAVLLVWAMNRIRGRRVLSDISLTMSFGASYGVITELLQSYIPSRTACLRDAAANISGLVFGLIVIHVVMLLIYILPGVIRNSRRFV